MGRRSRAETTDGGVETGERFPPVDEISFQSTLSTTLLPYWRRWNAMARGVVAI